MKIYLKKFEKVRNFWIKIIIFKLFQFILCSKISIASEGGNRESLFPRNSDTWFDDQNTIMIENRKAPKLKKVISFNLPLPTKRWAFFLHQDHSFWKNSCAPPFGFWPAKKQTKEKPKKIKPPTRSATPFCPHVISLVTPKGGAGQRYKWRCQEALVQSDHNTQNKLEQPTTATFQPYLTSFTSFYRLATSDFLDLLPSLNHDSSIFCSCASLYLRLCLRSRSPSDHLLLWLSSLCDAEAEWILRADFDSDLREQHRRVHQRHERGHWGLQGLHPQLGQLHPLQGGRRLLLLHPWLLWQRHPVLWLRWTRRRWCV